MALAQKVQELARYRSDFFGRLRQILGDKPGIRIVGARGRDATDVPLINSFGPHELKGFRVWAYET